VGEALTTGSASGADRQPFQILCLIVASWDTAIYRCAASRASIRAVKSLFSSLRFNF
jgi:hypothetical protein